MKTTSKNKAFMNNTHFPVCTGRCCDQTTSF